MTVATAVSLAVPAARTYRPPDSVWAWLMEYYDLNIDPFLNTAWPLLGTLTIIASVVMVRKIFYPYRNLEP